MLTGCAVRNAGRVRLECALDTGMNAVLSEFHIGLFERYGLIYVDASYLEKKPAVSNVEDRLAYYLEENTVKVLERKNSPWGSLQVEGVSVSSFETAAADLGASMRNQAVLYVEDTGISGEEREAVRQKGDMQALDMGSPMSEWCSIMEQLAGMELPLVQNEEGLWEEVPLSNPADWVYGLTGSDIFYLAQIGPQPVNSARIPLQDYISHRQTKNMDGSKREYRKDEDLFLSYLFHKMGCLGNEREGSLLSCQLEYIAQGKGSDLENVREVAERLFRWRFADNASLALTDGDLRAQALAAAGELEAVCLKEEFRGPVAESILYACAFLESVGDLKTIYSGGSIPLRKSGHQMSVYHVLNGSLYCTGSEAGLFYEQYLAGMILLTEEKAVNLRAMDIMEMDLRFSEGNKNFSMDWCIERFEADVTACGTYGSHYSLKRKYGYF